MAIPVIMKGSDYSKYDSYTIKSCEDDTVAGISTGKSKQKKRKSPSADRNEDSLSIFTLPGNEALYIVADGHYDSRASEMAVLEFPVILSRNLENNRKIEALYVSVFELDERIRSSQISTNPEVPNWRLEGNSTTTFAAALKQGNEIDYISIGSPYIFELKKIPGLFWDSIRINHLNKKHKKPLYEPSLGHKMPLISSIKEDFEYLYKNSGITDYDKIVDEVGKYINEEGNLSVEASVFVKDFIFKKPFNYPGEGTEMYNLISPAIGIGKFALEEDSPLLLTTDGINKHCSGVSIKKLAKFVSNSNLGEGVEKYFETVMKKSTYKGSDNIAMIAFR